MFVSLYLLNVCHARALSERNLPLACSLIFHTVTTTKGKRETVPIADISRSRVRQQIGTVKALLDLFLGRFAPGTQSFQLKFIHIPGNTDTTFVSEYYHIWSTHPRRWLCPCPLGFGSHSRDPFLSPPSARFGIRFYLCPFASQSHTFFF